MSGVPHPKLQSYKRECRGVSFRPQREVMADMVGRLTGMSEAERQSLHAATVKSVLGSDVAEPSPDRIPRLGAPELPASPAARRILVLLDGQHVIEYAPALVTVIKELVEHAGEADVYAAACAIVRRARVDLYFLPITRMENTVFLKAAHALVEKRDPRVHAHLRATCPQFDQWLEETMWSFFGNLFPDRRPQLVSMFLAEGSKILYRLLLGFTRAYSSILLAKPGAESLPEAVAQARADPDNAFDRVASTGFGIRRFSRKKLYRVHALQRAEMTGAEPRPLSSPPGAEDSPTGVSVPFSGRVLPSADGFNGALLAAGPSPASVGVDWISYLPLSETLARADLELIYTTEQHGWGLQRLYQHCAGAAPTLLLVSTQAAEGEEPAVFGAFSHVPWRPQRRPFGDGRCLLFRVRPSPAVFPWRGSAPPKKEGEEEPSREAAAAAAAAMETFMIATPDLLSLGAAVDHTASGLRLDETLERGSSEPCDTYGNEPLHVAAGVQGAAAFGVSCVEVYRFRPQRPKGKGEGPPIRRTVSAAT